MQAIIESPVTALTIEQWTQQGEKLVARHNQVLWEVATWLEHGVRQFGDAAQDIALVQFGQSKAQIRKAMDVSRRFAPEQRRPELTFNHHALVLPLEDDQAEKVLDQAVATNASLSAVKKTVNAIRESQGGDVFQQMAAVNMDELADDWYGKMIRLSNRAPNQEIRDSFVEALAENNNGLIMDGC